MECDTLVIGAGILGVASAYYIKRNNRSQNVLLVDVHLTAGQGNTAKSNGMFRNTFTSVDNQVLSDSSIDFYIDTQKEGFNLGIQKIGYLWLLSKKGESNYSRHIEKMMQNGIELAVYPVDELSKKVEFKCVPDSEIAKLIELEPVSVGVLGKKCGRLSPEKLVQYYLEMFLSLGGKVIFGHEVEKLILSAVKPLGLEGEPFVWQEWKVREAVIKGKDEGIRFRNLVLACGAWLNRLVEPVGLDFQIKSKKRQIFAIDAKGDDRLSKLMFCQGFNELGLLPMIILPKSGIHFRPVKESSEFWVACEDDINREFINSPESIFEDYKAEDNYFRLNILPVLQEYFPAFANPRINNKWAGLYAYHLPDSLPVVHKESNLVVVGGDSGSGIMKADSLGRIVDALLRGKEYATLYNGKKYPVERLGVKNRKVEPEEWVI